MSEIKDMIIYYRKINNMSQAELAKKLGVSPSTVGNYELGTRMPKPEIEEAMADLFNVSLDHLRGIDTERKAPLIKPEYIELVDKFSKLSPSQQKIITDTIQAFLADNN